MKRLQNFFIQATFFLNILLLFFLFFESKLHNLPSWVQVAGRMHPMILHFPIVLLVVTLLTDWFFLKTGSEVQQAQNSFLIALTAFSASATAICGLILFHSGQYEEGPVMIWHKWTGISVALLSGMLLYLHGKKRIIYSVSLVITVFITIIAGHYGASITHGEGFLTGPLQKERKIIITDSSAVFGDIIQPILNEKCTGCHNPNKSKGELQLISKETINKGGKDGIVLVPGNPDTSLLYKYLLLPLEDKKHMPPEGKPQPEPEEIALLRWWIASGASYSKTLAATNPPDSISRIIKTKFGSASPLDALAIDFASPETIEKLNNPGRGVRQVSIEKPYIAVFLANKADFTKKDLDQLEPISKQVISIDLSNSSITDDQLSLLHSFPNLTRLYLEQTGITEKGIQSIKSLRFLEYLNVSGTNVTPKILDELKAFPSLKKLFLYDTDIPLADIDEFGKNKKTLYIGFSKDLSSDTAFTGKLSDPIVTIDSNLFRNAATVDMSFRLKSVDLHYTTNGKDPDLSSPVYKTPLRIDSSCTLKVIAIKKGWQSGPIVSYPLQRAKYRIADAKLNPLPDERYAARLDTTLIDLQKGSESHADGKYIGYEGKSVDVFLDLGEPIVLTKISLGYIVNHGAFVLQPGAMQVYESNAEGKMLHKLGELKVSASDLKKDGYQGTMSCPLRKNNSRYLVVKIINVGRLPSWHPSRGKPSWIFLDEIIAN